MRTFRILTIGFVTCIALVMLAGCAPPKGVTMAMATAHASLKVTSDEAIAADRDPWQAADGETAAQTHERMERQVAECLAVMNQAAKNLDTVEKYFKAGYNPLAGIFKWGEGGDDE